MSGFIVQRTLIGVLALLLLSGASRAQQQKLVGPSELQQIIMIKTALITFNDANASGNYTVLRDLASPEFQQTNTAARLADIFRAERERKIDLSPIVLLQPTLRRPAWIDAQGLLRLDGFFPSKPAQVNFALAYKAVGGWWRLHALGVVTTDAVAVSSADSPAAPRAPAAAQEPERRPAPQETAARPSGASDFISRNWPHQMTTGTPASFDVFGAPSRSYASEFK